MKLFLGLATLVLILGVNNISNADPINQTPYASLTGTYLITFDDVAGGAPPGTNYDTIFESGGTLFAERFVGQTLSYSGDFDVISGTPTGGTLNLQVGLPNQNLNVVFFDGSNVIDGLGPTGYPNFNAIGEGALSLLFDNDQSEFGFKLGGGNNGSAFINFFMRDGSLIDSITVANLTDTYYGFTRDGGLKDIAGITLWNNDEGGIYLDDLKFDVAPNPIPEPTTMLLLGTGLVGVAGAARRRKKNQA